MTITGRPHLLAVIVPCVCVFVAIPHTGHIPFIDLLPLIHMPIYIYIPATFTTHSVYGLYKLAVFTTHAVYGLYSSLLHMPCMAFIDIYYK